MILCSCFRVSDRDLRAELEAGACCADDLARRTGAGTECGACREDVEEIVEEHSARARVTDRADAA